MRWSLCSNGISFASNLCTNNNDNRNNNNNKNNQNNNENNNDDDNTMSINFFKSVSMLVRLGEKKKN